MILVGEEDIIQLQFSPLSHGQQCDHSEAELIVSRKQDPVRAEDQKNQFLIVHSLKTFWILQFE